MVDLLTPDKLMFFVALFIPGFVILKIWEMLIPSKERDLTAAFPNVISYSVIHYALTAWPLLLLRPPLYWIYAYLDVLVFPIMWPIVVLIVRNARGDLTVFFDTRFTASLVKIYRGFAAVQPMPTPWDEVFRMSEAFWVRICTKDGRWVGGRMLEGSHASTYPKRRELFIKDEYEMDQETGEFKERLPSTAGVWIAEGQIAVLELFRGADVEGAA